MKQLYFAALALTAATSLRAQATGTDLSYATPIGGNWSYAATADGSEAVFNDAYAKPRLWLRCARATRRVSIALPATAAAGSINVWTSSNARDFAASFDATAARLSITFAPFDPMLDAVATSRGRIGFSIAGQPPLVLPPWAEVARVVEDCRA